MKKMSRFMNATGIDQKYLRLALKFAEKGRGRVSPNPTVGACIVKNNRLISSGYHEYFGGPHAEMNAMQKAGSAACGATLYVTLEPCSTYGKTPPCVDAICKARFKRVVIGTKDPNPIHTGRSVRILSQNRIATKVNVLKSEAEAQIEAYAKWIQTKRPFVTLKMAQSLDGKIASRTGESRWISGEPARAWVHKLRRSSDAVLVGKNTITKDNSRLTVHVSAKKKIKNPWRIVLDAQGSVSPAARVFRLGGPTILACSQNSFQKVTQKFKNTAVTILPLPLKHKMLDLRVLLKQLGEMGISSLLVEGGGEVAASFLNEKLVDKVVWIVAPLLIGGRSAKTSVEGEGVKILAKAPRVLIERFRRLGNDFLFEGRLAGA